MEKEDFSSQVKRKEVRKKKGRTQGKQRFQRSFQEDNSLRSGTKSVSPKKTPLSLGFAGPTPDGFNLPGVVDLSVRVVKNAQDNQEELVMEDTPPGPGPAGFLTDSHETVSGDGTLALTVPWPFLFFLVRGAALISTVSSLLTVSSPLLGLLDCGGRRASRAARRVQISENSFHRSGKCVDSAQTCSF